MAAASTTSLNAACKVKERSDTLAATPNLAGALGDGAVTAGHVDVVTRCSKQLHPAVGYDRCELHHITWWRHGGSTDIDNLLPICTKHRTKIHHDGWTIELGPNRQLTLRLPDGNIQTTGPPTIRAA